MKKIIWRKNEHQYVTQRLSAWIDGTLSERERARLQAHLQSCEVCRQELESLLWIKRLLRQTPTVPTPRSFVVRPADLETSPVTARQRPLVAARWATALVSLLFVVVLLGDLLSAPSPMGKSRIMAPAAETTVVVQQNFAGHDWETPAGSEATDQTAVARPGAVNKSVEQVTETVVVEKAVAETVVVEKEVAETVVVEMVVSPTPEPLRAMVTMSDTTDATQVVSTEPAPMHLAVETTPPSEETPTATPAPQAQEPILEPAQHDLRAEETPMSGEGALENRPSRLAWRIAEIGLGTVLAALIVLWIVMRKRI